MAPMLGEWKLCHNWVIQVYYILNSFHKNRILTIAKHPVFKMTIKLNTVIVEKCLILILYTLQLLQGIGHGSDFKKFEEGNLDYIAVPCDIILGDYISKNVFEDI